MLSGTNWHQDAGRRAAGEQSQRIETQLNRPREKPELSLIKRSSNYCWKEMWKDPPLLNLANEAFSWNQKSKLKTVFFLKSSCFIDNFILLFAYLLSVCLFWFHYSLTFSCHFCRYIMCYIQRSKKHNIMWKHYHYCYVIYIFKPW